MSRDLSFFWSVSGSLSAVGSAFILPLNAAFCTTGKLMLGGREQFKLEGYWLVIGVCTVLTVAAAPISWLAARMARRNGGPAAALVDEEEEGSVRASASSSQWMGDGVPASPPPSASLLSQLRSAYGDAQAAAEVRGAG